MQTDNGKVYKGMNLWDYVCFHKFNKEWLARKPHGIEDQKKWVEEWLEKHLPK